MQNERTRQKRQYFDPRFIQYTSLPCDFQHLHRLRLLKRSRYLHPRFLDFQGKCIAIEYLYCDDKRLD